jgi:hypothetical protein
MYLTLSAEFGQRGAIGTVKTRDHSGEDTELSVRVSDLADGIDEGSSPHGAVTKEREVTE